MGAEAGAGGAVETREAVVAAEPERDGGKAGDRGDGGWSDGDV